MKKALKFIWCLPQNLIGFVLHVICKAKGRQNYKYKDAHVVVWHFSSGVSFGNYIFIPIWSLLLDTEYVKHEYGHTLQSRKLGWLYLPIIYLPSLIWNTCFREYRRKHNVDYYSFIIERHADKLGGVVRKK